MVQFAPHYIQQPKTPVEDFLKNIVSGYQYSRGQTHEMEKIAEQARQQKALKDYENDLALKKLEKEYGYKKDIKTSEFERKNTPTPEDEANYNQVAEAFGDKFAKIWKAAPQGGKTELLKHGLDAKARGIDLQSLLENVKIPEQPPSTQNQISEQIPQMKDGQIPKDFKWPDFIKAPQGYTPKDWREEKSTWRKENAPIFEQNKTRLKNVERDILGTKKLNKLNESKKLPEGMARIILDPDTGQVRGYAQLAGLANKETQEWVKEQARFQNRAKDTFGSRVTNFDLQSYMMQFPGLLNTYEGRKGILRMMEINYDLDKLYDTALNKVYQKYGLSGIPQEEADRLAQGMIEDETNRLHNEYLGIQDQIEMKGGHEQKNLTPEIALEYLKKAKGNEKEAKEMAKQDGYQF